MNNKDNLVPELSDAWKANGLKKSGTWEEVFGPGKPKGQILPVRNLVPPMTQKEQDEALVTYPYYSDEVFMAWYYAKYINYVVDAGKAEYSIPMFVNAWLKQREYSWPGTYPSGGCLPQVFDIYHAAAPSIDILCPDLYRPDFANLCELFTRSGNPLFISETSCGVEAAANVVYAVRHHNALGFSPFYVKKCVVASGELTQSYEMLSQLIPLIGKHQGMNTMNAVLLTNENPSQTVDCGDYIIQTKLRQDNRYKDSGGKEQVAAIFIMNAPCVFFIGGSGIIVSFSPKISGTKTGLATVEEGVFSDGKWIPGRRLADDDTDQRDEIKFGVGYNIQKVSLYNYK